MTTNQTIAERILSFNEDLSKTVLELPSPYYTINPFVKFEIKKITNEFYHKYYDDNLERRMILGSSPARRGSALLGIPFETAEHLQNDTGIYINDFYINKSKSDFLFDIMQIYGGHEKFYKNFYLNFVCPLGICKINNKNNEVNCNYYENKKLQDILNPFIRQTLRQQIEFGIDTSVCYCIGSGENYKFLKELNDEMSLFKSIIPLEHPRFIMQYHSEDKKKYMDKYLHYLCNK